MSNIINLIDNILDNNIENINSSIKIKYKEYLACRQQARLLKMKN